MKTKYQKRLERRVKKWMKKHEKRMSQVSQVKKI